MKKLSLIIATIWLTTSCNKYRESQYQCGILQLTLPEGWSFDFVNNDFTTLSMVDSSWSFSPKSWSGNRATGQDAGAELFVLIGDLNTNSALKNLTQTSETFERDLLELFFDEYSNQYDENLLEHLSEPKEVKYSSGTWYVFSKKQQNTFEEKPNDYLLQLYIKTFDEKVYMIFIKDFEKNFEINREKYFDKILNAIKFV
ncbi:hypothetical protein JCM31826_10290 [Thermaurantimonas aggregans]|uniref:Uncharacterized protein n=1 Tax=Thermaurantimonas aggregans TaxID=2173829 RepID=A0A401XKH8_9FLAO|nr:hypothetical protein [Thermaurantimonas aggregans]MCX8147884.1 hypothetical protein [Thermaurantimonas aggregans]GCD77547.1 hypothetical protein JCM31826_10290 [Thermaurantimonas aggregans]